MHNMQALVFVFHQHNISNGLVQDCSNSSALAMQLQLVTAVLH